MKRMLMLCAVLLVLLSTASFAAESYVGLFTDEAHWDCDFFGYGYSLFRVWLWCYPGPGGLEAVQLAIEIPSYIYVANQWWNPDIPLTIEPLCEDWECSIPFMTCQTYWVYCFQLECMMSSTVVSSINILPYPPSGGVNFITCEPGNPVIPATVFCNFAINQPCYFAVEESSWGAIKGLYR